MGAWLLWLVTGIYAYVALEQAYLRNPNMTIVYLGYAIANVGLIRGVS